MTHLIYMLLVLMIHMTLCNPERIITARAKLNGYNSSWLRVLVFITSAFLETSVY